jgi:hypothetical protein
VVKYNGKNWYIWKLETVETIADFWLPKVEWKNEWKKTENKTTFRK